MDNFQVHLDIDGQTAILKMKGDLTHTSEQRMNSAYDKAVRGKAKYLILDFHNVEYINSAGMSIIITMLTKAQEENRELAACGLTAHFQKIFNMVGLSKYITHHDTLDAAQKSFMGKSA